MRSIRLPFACAALLLGLKLRGATWGWLPAWAFWMVAVLLVLVGVALFIHTVLELARLVRQRHAPSVKWLSILVALVLLVLAFREMR